MERWGRQLGKGGGRHGLKGHATRGGNSGGRWMYPTMEHWGCTYETGKERHETQEDYTATVCWVVDCVGDVLRSAVGGGAGVCGERESERRDHRGGWAGGVESAGPGAGWGERCGAVRRG